MNHLHVGIDMDHFAKHFDTLVDREKRLLGVVPENRNDQPVEHSRTALDEIEMAVGNGSNDPGYMAVTRVGLAATVRFAFSGSYYSTGETWLEFLTR